jgi:hypothetical protein
MFMAQTGHETDSYNTFSEYVNADGTNAWCKNYDGGCTYRGRGAIQLTHKYNYARAGTELGVDFVSNPNIVATPQYAFTVGGLYWSWRSLNTCSDNRDIDTCTRLINGGTNGIADRVTKYNSAKTCITSLGGNAPTPSGTSCTVPGVGNGKCQDTATACSGSYYSGYCPGAANIRCCAPKAKKRAEADSDDQQTVDNAAVGTQDEAAQTTPMALSPAGVVLVVVGSISLLVGIAVVVGLIYRKRQDMSAMKP